jgi:hypothetical protein
LKHVSSSFLFIRKKVYLDIIIIIIIIIIIMTRALKHLQECWYLKQSRDSNPNEGNYEAAWDSLSALRDRV